MKLYLHSDQFVPDFGNDYEELKTALVEFVFEKINLKQQPEFIAQFIKSLNEKRENMKNDLSNFINSNLT